MDSKQFMAGIQNEVDAAYLYARIAASDKDENVSAYYREMSEIESRHLQKMFEKGKNEGYLSTMPVPSVRARILDRIGKIFGYYLISNLMVDTEKSISTSVIRQKINKGEQLAGSETRHVTILKSLEQLSSESLTKIEGRHRNVGGNALRAAVLGANDGLVSNMSLVMGVAGATGAENTVLIAGLAGLLAGAISMALGEWISVKSSQELYERQIKLELQEIENTPEEEKQELILLYRTKGVPEVQAKEMAETVMGDTKRAHETLVHEELNINPDELKGSAWIAATASFLLFTIGAIIPVLPFFWLSGLKALFFGVGFSMVGLFLIGAAITLFTGKSIWFSGARQVLFGLAAGGITYGIGRLLGAALTG